MLFEVNTVGYTIFGLPPYLFFSLVSFIIGICTYIILLSFTMLPVSDGSKILSLSFIGLAFGAKLFGALSGVYGAIGQNTIPSFSKLFTETGIVFYGGLLGFISSFELLRRKYNLDRCFQDVLATVIPLFHSISRIGCFFAGCCYGCEFNGFLSIRYTTTVAGEVITLQRIPIQLVESLFCFVLFIILISRLLGQNTRTYKGLLWQYLALYSTGRFIIEFFRGDSIRGVVHGISFSQVVSLLIVVFLILTSKARRRNLKNGDIF